MIRGRRAALVVVGAITVAGCSTVETVDTAETVETAEPTAPADSLAGGLLSAVRYRQPTLITDMVEPGTTLDRIGGLLVDDNSFLGSYVDGDDWCAPWAGCVTVTSVGDDLQFAGVSIDEFELDTEITVTGDTDVDIVASRALYHPADDVLTMSIDLRSESLTWKRYVGPSFRSAGARLDDFTFAPNELTPGPPHRYRFVMLPESEFDGRAEFTMELAAGGVSTERRVTISGTITGAVPEVERRAWEPGPSRVRTMYRLGSEPAADIEGSGDLADLIDELAGGGDPMALVAADSPASIAVAAIAGLGDRVVFERDDADPSGACWTLETRSFCERWRAPVIENGAIVSWEIDGTSLVDIVVERAGSLPGSSVSMLASPVGGVVFGTVEVRNDGLNEVEFVSYPVVIDDGLATNPLVSGDLESIEAGVTASDYFVVIADDVDFELQFELWVFGDEPRLVFPASP